MAPEFYKFVIRQSALISSSLNHPCAILANYQFFVVFSTLLIYYFEVFFYLKVNFVNSKGLNLDKAFSSQNLVAKN